MGFSPRKRTLCAIAAVFIAACSNAVGPLDARTNVDDSVISSDTRFDAVSEDTVAVDTPIDAPTGDAHTDDASVIEARDATDAAPNPDGGATGRFCFTNFDCASGHCDLAVNRCTVECEAGSTSCPNADWTCGGDGLCHCTVRNFIDGCDGHDDDCDSVVDSSGCNGGRCVGGVCVCDAPGDTSCGDYCVDLQRNEYNCGACGTGCSTRYCEGGVCTCPSGQTNCDGACFDLDANRQHCGSCANFCAFDAQCTSGVCVCNNASLTACGGACVDLGTSTSHCGTCGNACPRGASCAGGTCSCPSAEPTVCANACVDLASDRQNCGACGTTCPVACDRSTCTTIAMIAAGTRTTVAILADGSTRWWGAEDMFGADRSRSLPGPVSPVEIDGGNGFACARTAGGAVACWGDNGSAQLANGDTTPSTAPLAVYGLTDVVDIAVGPAHACAVQRDGAAFCWGAPTAGELGNGEYTLAFWARRVRTTSNLRRIFAGGAFTCAVGSDGASCWGHNFYGELGDGTNTERLTPVPVVGLTSGIVTLAAGERHACALLDDGTVRCWGDNSSGQLGDGTTTSRDHPIVVPALADVVDIGAGNDFTVALLRDGSLRWWGRTPDTLATGFFPGDYFLVPTALPAFPTFTTIDAGSMHVCGFTTGGSAVCWGSNSSGQLADRTPGVTGFAMPMPVAL